MHFSEALWTIRQCFLGTDQGRTYDSAVYAGVVGIQKPTYDTLSAAVCAAVGASFPSVASAQQTCTQGFADRGVTGCDDILDAQGTSVSRDYFGVGGTQELTGTATYVPGPLQFKLHATGAASKVSLVAQLQGGGVGGLLGGGGQPNLSALISVGQPITFTGGANGLTDDAQLRLSLAVNGGNVTGQQDLTVPCAGADVYVAVINGAQSDAALAGLNVALTDGATCPSSGSSGGSTGSAGSSGGTSGGVSAGSTGGGSSGTAGTTGGAGTTSAGAASTTGSTGSGAKAKTGCGCGSSDAVSLAGALLGALALRRRRR
jgi:hypothetical protein